jgi:DNA polymerase-3 subunit delta
MNTPVHTSSTQIHIFSGEDEYRLAEDARKLVDRLLPPEDQALGLEIIEARSRNAAEAGTSIVKCIEALRTPGFMGARKVVWLRDVNFLDRGLIARSNEVTEMLASLTDLINSGLPGNNVLVATIGKLDKESDFFKACRSIGEIHQQTAIKPWEKDRQAAEFARSVMRENKLQAEQGVIDMIIELVGTDSRQLSQEIKKLAVFISPAQTVTKNDVSAIVSSSRESTSFNLAEAAGFRDLPKAIEILRQLLFQQEKTIGLIRGLEYRFRLLLILKEMTAGKITADKKSALESLLVNEKGRMPHEYFLKKLAEQASQFSRQELESARKEILETDFKLVSSTSPDRVLLEKLLVKICGYKKIKPAAKR